MFEPDCLDYPHVFHNNDFEVSEEEIPFENNRDKLMKQSFDEESIHPNRISLQQQRSNLFSCKDHQSPCAVFVRRHCIGCV